MMKRFRFVYHLLNGDRFGFERLLATEHEAVVLLRALRNQQLEDQWTTIWTEDGGTAEIRSDHVSVIRCREILEKSDDSNEQATPSGQPEEQEMG